MTVATWIPLVPSMLIEAGEVEQFLVEGKDVAVWRSMQGHIQIWENRCPHRSVRLSLGQVRGESLVCAYHGWQFAAKDGQCQRIPAQPEQRAPSSLCVPAYAAMEQAGMIWLGRQSESPSVAQAEHLSPQVYAGSVRICTALAQAQDYLRELGLMPAEHAYAVEGLSWRGVGGDAALRLYLTPTQSEFITVHAMLIQQDMARFRHPLLIQMRQFLQQEQPSHA